PRVGDDVEDIAGRHAELGSEAVRHGLYFAHVDVGDGEKAKAVAVTFGIDHTIHLVVDAVEQAVGVEGPRNAEFGVRMAADSGLKDDEVVRIARRERQVVDLVRGDGAAGRDARRFDHGRAPSHFDLGSNGADLELRFHYGLRTGGEVHAGVAFGGE